MLFFRNIFLFITAASALAVSKRDTRTVLSDISTIGNNVEALTATFNRYNGGIYSAIPILGAVDNVGDSIEQGRTDAKASPQQTSAQSNAIITAINKLITNIQSALSAAKAKKGKFAADGLSSTVQSNIDNLQEQADDFADAIIAIASADTKAAVKAQKAKIGREFNAAIAYFN